VIGGDEEAALVFAAASMDPEFARYLDGTVVATDVGGGVRLRLRLNNLAEVERWILSWGTHATVLRPERLRETLRKTAQSLLDAYRGARKEA
jgi:predicted DNA-binding transcriptional regulator YafY